MGSIPCGFGASAIIQRYYLVTSSDPGIQPTSKIGANKYWGNGMMADPYPHPQHMKVVNHLVYVWVLYEKLSHGFGASTAAQMYRLVLSSDPGFPFLASTSDCSSSNRFRHNHNIMMAN